MKTTSNRRTKPRSSYSATAVVFLGNEQFTARIVNISASGVLIYPPVRRSKGTFLRLHLSLPALREMLDVDGVVVRETTHKGYYAWGVHFHDPTPDVVALLDTYVTWKREKVAQRLALLAQEKAQKSTGRGHPAVGRPTTGGGFPAVGSTATGPELPAVRGATPAQDTPATGQGQRQVDRSTTGPHHRDVVSAKKEQTRKPSRVRSEAEARWHERAKATKADQELQHLYRAALRDVLGKRSTKNKPEADKKKKGWFW